MGWEFIGKPKKNALQVDRHFAVLTLLFAVPIALLAQDQRDKSAPNDKNTDLQFRFAVTNHGKLGTYRVVRLDTGETWFTGNVGLDVSSRTTLINEFRIVGIPARTPVLIQVQGADGSWSTVDRFQVHYPPEPSDSQRFLDDAGFRGNFQVPDSKASNPSPSPSPQPMTSPTPAPSVQGSDSSNKKQQ
ncbi:MAG: hypothetical protein JO308_02960 [Verrucomicrobia bacterium]|nr:hypothetical protein [Verrucomicrobiota bacterium]